MKICFVSKLTNFIIFGIIYIKLLIHIFFLKYINIILKYLIHIRVYDLVTNDNLTITYYSAKFLAMLNCQLSFNYIYPCIGVCTYIEDRYVRYICYNTKITDVIKPETALSSKNYHTIKKMELITKSKINTSYDIFDVTDAKNQLYDVNNFTKLIDVVRFYKRTRSHINNIDMLCENNLIRIQREYFDDNLLELVRVHSITPMNK